jgi:hypothetical protein
MQKHQKKEYDLKSYIGQSPDDKLIRESINEPVEQNEPDEYFSQEDASEFFKAQSKKEE